MRTHYYLCICYKSHRKTSVRSQQELQQIKKESSSEWVSDEVRSSIKLEVCIDGVGTSIVRCRDSVCTSRAVPNDDKSVASMFVVKAKDLDHAVQLASMHPKVRSPMSEFLGWHIEVFPITNLDVQGLGACIDMPYIEERVTAPEIDFS